jgi:hypothetical protein
MTEFDKKLVAVLNQKVEAGKIMNALAHAMLGFGAGQVAKEEIYLSKYEDADGNIHDNISEMGIVVLRASSNKIRTIKNRAKEMGLKYVDFVETMSVGTYEEEFNLTKTKKDEDLNYWALILYGEYDQVTELTGKLSLYR